MVGTSNQSVPEMAGDKSLIFRTQIAFPLIGSSEKTEANPYNHLGEPALVQPAAGASCRVSRA